MSKISKKHDYEQEADELSLGIAKKSKNEKELTHNLGKSLDADFSKVRVSHEDLNGETAYTKGNDIHLDHSVDTGTSFGRQVLGHEMVHTAQQSGQGSMVSQAPAGTAQFFPKKDENGDLKLNNKFSYRKDKEYQDMYKKYNEYIKDKKNPEKKMAAIKAASDYMMHNTDLSGFSEDNPMENQKHKGRMAIAEEIIYNLTIKDDTITNAKANLKNVQDRAELIDDPIARGTVEKTAKLIHPEDSEEIGSGKILNDGINKLKDVMDGKIKVSKTLQTVTAGTLGNHMGSSVQDLKGVKKSKGSGVTPIYDKNGNISDKILNVNVNAWNPEAVGATTLHELTHMANGNVYGNTMEMSIARNVGGESEDEKNQRYREKAHRRFQNLSEMWRVNNLLYKSNGAKAMLDGGAISYAGSSDKFAEKYAPNTMASIIDGGNRLGKKNAGEVSEIMKDEKDKEKIRDRNRLKEVMNEKNIFNTNGNLSGEKGENVDQMLRLMSLNDKMKASKEGNLTTLIEYDSKLTDLLFQLETTNQFSEANPLHRRLKAMVMESFAEREMQRIQNEADAKEGKDQQDTSNNGVVGESLKKKPRRDFLSRRGKKG